MKSDVCPACHRPFGAVSKRVCAECKKPILKYHKWQFMPNGTIEHRHCDEPEAYIKDKKHRVNN